MPKAAYTASEAAAALGISLDTLRRWDKAGRITVTRDAGNKRVVSAKEIDRLRGDRQHITARNRFRGTVTDVQVDGLMAQVELQSGPHRIVSLMSAEAAVELGLEVGSKAVAVTKATMMIIEAERA